MGSGSVRMGGAVRHGHRGHSEKEGAEGEEHEGRAGGAKEKHPCVVHTKPPQCRFALFVCLSRDLERLEVHAK